MGEEGFGGREGFRGGLLAFLRVLGKVTRPWKYVDAWGFEWHEVLLSRGGKVGHSRICQEILISPTVTFAKGREGRGEGGDKDGKRDSQL